MSTDQMIALCWLFNCRYRCVRQDGPGIDRDFIF